MPDRQNVCLSIRADAAARRTKSHAPAVWHAALGFSVEKQPVFRKRSRRNAAIRRLYIAAEHERQPRHERAALPASRAETFAKFPKIP